MTSFASPPSLYQQRKVQFPQLSIFFTYLCEANSQRHHKPNAQRTLPRDLSSQWDSHSNILCTETPSQHCRRKRHFPSLFLFSSFQKRKKFSTFFDNEWKLICKKNSFCKIENCPLSVSTLSYIRLQNEIIFALKKYISNATVCDASVFFICIYIFLQKERVSVTEMTMWLDCSVKT